MGSSFMWLGVFGEKGEKILVNIDSITHLRPTSERFDGGGEELEGTLYIGFGNGLSFRVDKESSRRLMDALTNRFYKE